MWKSCNVMDATKLHQEKAFFLANYTDANSYLRLQSADVLFKHNVELMVNNTLLCVAKLLGCTLNKPCFMLFLIKKDTYYFKLKVKKKQTNIESIDSCFLGHLQIQIVKDLWTGPQLFVSDHDISYSIFFMCLIRFI